MSLRPLAVYRVPEDTARVARAAFPRGNPYLQLYDEVGRLYEDQTFAALFPTRGQPALAPAQLALVTIMQFAEGLADRQAADAVRSRIDWKYLLCLELTDPGFDHSVLSEFRDRLLAGAAETLLLETLLARCRELGLLRARGRQRRGTRLRVATQVLAAVRTLNRLELVGETLRHALNALATVAPDWLRAQAPPAWSARYGARLDEYRLPKEASARQALAATIGQDGRQLLLAVAAPTAPAWLREIPAVATLRQVWVQQYHAPDEAGVVRWRTEADQPPAALRLVSPHDPDARYGVKGETAWDGYKVHLTETCEPELPQLVSDVQTTAATTPDSAMTGMIHRRLAQRQLLPGKHMVDGGYIDAAHLVTSRTVHGVELVGPAPADTSWQARAGRGFDAASFTLDWDRQQATCPQGRRSVQWQPGQDRHGNAVIAVRFATADCRACPCRAQCTRSVERPRTLTVRPQAQQQALQMARARQQTPDFQADYARRAGVEGTLSQGVRVCGLRRCRYIGQAKAHLQQVLIAVALNVVRLIAWLAGRPRAQTRPAPFARLAPLGTGVAP